MFHRGKIIWSPVELEYLKTNRNTISIEQLTIQLAKSRNAIINKLKELDGKYIPTKKNKFSKIGKRKDLGISVRSGWEADFLRYLNYNNIKWLYEPKSFHFTDVKKGTTSFLPDVFLPELDIWIEIKGYLKNDDKVRIKRFAKYYPEEFKKLQVVVASENCASAKWYKSLAIPVYCYYNEIKKEYKSKIIEWES